jgi:hypothetical protein
MQATNSLSESHLATLQSVLTFLESVTVTLDTESRPTIETDVELTKTVRNLGLYCKDRMLDSFPALAEWRALGDGR